MNFSKSVKMLLSFSLLCTFYFSIDAQEMNSSKESLTNDQVIEMRESEYATQKVIDTRNATKAIDHKTKKVIESRALSIEASDDIKSVRERALTIELLHLLIDFSRTFLLLK